MPTETSDSVKARDSDTEEVKSWSEFAIRDERADWWYEDVVHPFSSHEEDLSHNSSSSVTDSDGVDEERERVRSNAWVKNRVSEKGEKRDMDTYHENDRSRWVPRDGENSRISSYKKDRNQVFSHHHKNTPYNQNRGTYLGSRNGNNSSVLFGGKAKGEREFVDYKQPGRPGDYRGPKEGVKEGGDRYYNLGNRSDLNGISKGRAVSEVHTCVIDGSSALSTKEDTSTYAMGGEGKNLVPLPGDVADQKLRMSELAKKAREKKQMEMRQEAEDKERLKKEVLKRFNDSIAKSLRSPGAEVPANSHNSAFNSSSRTQLSSNTETEKYLASHRQNFSPSSGKGDHQGYISSSRVKPDDTFPEDVYRGTKNHSSSHLNDRPLYHTNKRDFTHKQGIGVHSQTNESHVEAYTGCNEHPSVISRSSSHVNDGASVSSHRRRSKNPTEESVGQVRILQSSLKLADISPSPQALRRITNLNKQSEVRTFEMDNQRKFSGAYDGIRSSSVRHEEKQKEWSPLKKTEAFTLQAVDEARRSSKKNKDKYFSKHQRVYTDRCTDIVPRHDKGRSNVSAMRGSFENNSVNSVRGRSEGCQVQSQVTPRSNDHTDTEGKREEERGMERKKSVTSAQETIDTPHIERKIDANGAVKKYWNVTKYTNRQSKEVSSWVDSPIHSRASKDDGNRGSCANFDSTSKSRPIFTRQTFSADNGSDEGYYSSAGKPNSVDGRENKSTERHYQNTRHSTKGVSRTLGISSSSRESHLPSKDGGQIPPSSTSQPRTMETRMRESVHKVRGDGDRAHYTGKQHLKGFVSDGSFDGNNDIPEDETRPSNLIEQNQILGAARDFVPRRTLSLNNPQIGRISSVQSRSVMNQIPHDFPTTGYNGYPSEHTTREVEYMAGNFNDNQLVSGGNFYGSQDQTIHYDIQRTRLQNSMYYSFPGMDTTSMGFPGFRRDTSTEIIVGHQNPPVYSNPQFDPQAHPQAHPQTYQNPHSPAYYHNGFSQGEHYPLVVGTPVPYGYSPAQFQVQGNVPYNNNQPLVGMVMSTNSGYNHISSTGDVYCQEDSRGCNRDGFQKEC